MLLVLYKFLAGIFYPFFVVGLVFGVHRALVKIKPLESDPRHYQLQYAVIGGGAISVATAYFVSGGVNDLTALGYSALAMGGLATLSIVWEQLRLAKSKSKAKNAMLGAQQARQLIQLGEAVDAVKQLEESLLVCEMAYGSYHLDVAQVVMYLAEAMGVLGRALPTRMMLARAVGIYTRLGFSQEGALNALERYVQHLLQSQDYDAALAQAQVLVLQVRKLHGEGERLGRARLLLSRVQHQSGKLEDAYQSSKLAVTFLEKASGRTDKSTISAKAVHAHQGILLGRVAEGERLLRETILAKEQAKDNLDAEFLGLLLDHVTVLERAKSPEAAEVMCRAAALYRTEIGPEYPRAKELNERLIGYLSAGPNADYKPFYEAMIAGRSLPAREELQKHPALVTHVDPTGWTALQWAIFLGQPDIAERLLSLGADIAVGAGHDYPPLIIAARWSRKSLIGTLFRRDADVEIESVDGSRPIHAAVRSRDPFTYDTIAARGAKIDHANKRGWTPLHEAAFVGNRKILLQLLTKGADLNFQGGTHRETPLHAAILGGYCSTTETLILNAADLQAQDNDGFTPLELAESTGKQELLALLKAHLDTSSEPVDEQGVSVEESVDGEEQSDADSGEDSSELELTAVNES